MVLLQKLLARPNQNKTHHQQRDAMLRKLMQKRRNAKTPRRRLLTTKRHALKLLQHLQVRH